MRTYVKEGYEGPQRLLQECWCWWCQGVVRVSWCHQGSLGGSSAGGPRLGAQERLHPTGGTVSTPCVDSGQYSLQHAVYGYPPHTRLLHGCMGQHSAQCTSPLYQPVTQGALDVYTRARTGLSVSITLALLGPMEKIVELVGVLLLHLPDLLRGNL